MRLYTVLASLAVCVLYELHPVHSTPHLPDSSTIYATLADCSADDARYALNLWFYSYQRSALNIIMQQEHMQYLRAMWNAWHTCAQRRFNPSRLSDSIPLHTPYPCSETLFHTVATTYAYVANLAYHSSCIESAHLRSMIHDIRSRARSLVLEQLWEKFSHISHEMFNNLHDRWQEYHQLDEQIHDTTKGIFDQTLGYFAAFSFEKFDREFIEQSNTLMQKFIDAQEHYNALWKAIESSRAEYYRSCFIQWYNIMQELGFPHEAFIMISLPEVPHDEGATVTHLTPRALITLPSP